jgi:hypothetical protein
MIIRCRTNLAQIINVRRVLQQGRRVMNIFKILIFASLSALLSAPVSAAVLDEATRGDFSDSWSSPTAMTLEVGSNRVSGRTEPGPSGAVDVDYFTVTVPAATRLERIVLSDYSQTALTIDELPGRLGDRGAFLAMSRGNVAVVESNFQEKALGAVLVGVLPAADEGSDILEAMVFADDFIVSSLRPPLGPDDYTFWYQQNRRGVQGETRYSFDFVVTPLPGALPLLASGLLGLAAWARRRRHGG